MSTDNNFTQLCVWEGTLLGGPSTDSDAVKQFVNFIEGEFGVRIKFEAQVFTLPGRDGEGGRSDLFFYIHNDDIPKFAVRRFKYRIRWWEDVLRNGNEELYTEEFLLAHSKTW